MMPPVYRVQLVREAGRRRPEVNSGHDAAKILRRYLELEDREHFVILMLDVKNSVIGIHTASVGALNAAPVSPREVFKAAIFANAVILAHNHPSGDTAPLPEDFQVTDRLKRAGALLDIEVLDHVIIGENGAFVSMRANGLMPRD
jgi:DNA repair protein RadC